MQSVLPIFAGCHAIPFVLVCCFRCRWVVDELGGWRKYFGHYTPILDFVQALMYVSAGARAGRAANEGWLHDRDWAQWLWGGEVDRLLAALQERQQELGIPDKEETGTPRAQVTSSLHYLTNQRARMKYQEYRQQGLPSPAARSNPPSNRSTATSKARRNSGPRGPTPDGISWPIA